MFVVVVVPLANIAGSTVGAGLALVATLRVWSAGAARRS